MTVAAVIPHWNRARLLESLLANLRLQTRPFDEIIVVDNGSTDRSADLAEHAGAQVIRLDRNYGFAAAVNRGIAATKADWIAILNNDVTLDPAWLEQLLAAITLPTPERVRANALSLLEHDFENTLIEYTRRFGNVLNADHAAELFPDYSASLERRALFRVAVHPAAQRVRDELFERALADPHVQKIVFTAGGNGAGKTSGSPPGDIVYDSTLNNLEHARNCVRRCVEVGKRVHVDYTYRSIRESFLGVIHRAKSEGRTVAIDTIIRTHSESAKTAAALYQEYGGHPSVAFRFIENGTEVSRVGGVALTNKENYASSRDELYSTLEAQRHWLPEYLYVATAGRARGRSGPDRTADRRQSEQTPQAEARQSSLAFATGKILSAQNHATLDGAWDEISRAACPVRIGAGIPDASIWNIPRPISMTSMTACLIRRQAFIDIGPLDERFESYLEDVDFGLRCAKAGLAGVYEPAAVAYHQGSSTWGRWNPDTVRLLSRNQVLLVAKHFRSQPVWPILAGQLLWGLVALRHGCGLAWLKGKLAGRKLASSIENETRDTIGFGALLRESEGTILAQCHELYWRMYAWLAPLR